jgi:phosphoribosylformylglycinamidine cyclo-ligase
VGFAAFVGPGDAEPVAAAARASGHAAWIAGRVRRDGGRKAVVIPSLGITYERDTLRVRLA